MASAEAEEFKKKGNEAFKAGKWDDAIKAYNKAITLDPNNAAYYSNRAGAWSSKGNHESALADANRCIEKDTNFIKGYSRKGKALFDLGRLDEAEEAYKAGMDVDKTSEACMGGVSAVNAARRSRRAGSSGSGASPFGSIFGGGMFGQIMEKLQGGGRFQKYIFIMGGYFLFMQWMGKGKKGTTTSSEAQSSVLPEDLWESFPIRSFREADRTWVSYLHSESNSEALLLCLHQTASSAETDFGEALAKLSETTDSFPKGIRLLAPDRPCHGLSACRQDSGWGWLDRLYGLPTMQAQRRVIVAIGQDAAQQALRIAEQKPKATKLVLVSPRQGPPNMETKLGSVAEANAWLARQSTRLSATAAADALRWATSGGAKDSQVRKLSVADLPESEVLLVYLGDEEEDDTLKTALEAKGATVTTRSGEVDLPSLLADELRRRLEEQVPEPEPEEEAVQESPDDSEE